MAMQIVKPKKKTVQFEKHLSTPQTFGDGQEVRIARKSRVVDKERAHENIPKEARVPIDMDVTGATGTICGAAYESGTKKEACVPVMMRDGNIVGVPVKRLERVDRTPHREDSAIAVQHGPSPMSKENMDFWRKYFKREEESERLKRENRELKKKLKR